MSNIKSLVVAEHDHASLKGSTLNTISAATQLGGEVHVLVAGLNAAGAAQAAAQVAGVAQVLHADGESLAHGLAEAVSAQVWALAAAGGYSHILFPATAAGKKCLTPSRGEIGRGSNQRHHQSGGGRHL